MCGLPPTKRSFKVISLTVRNWFNYPIPNLSERDNGIKLTFSPKSHMALSIISYPMTHGMEKLPRFLSLCGNFFGRISIKFLNWSSNLDLTKPCVKGISGESNGFSFSPMAFSP
jgi:hypothetical protein